MFNSNICKTLIDNIFYDKYVFNRFFHNSGINYETVKDKEIKEITEICQKTFKSRDKSPDNNFQILSNEETERIFKRIEEIDNPSTRGGGNKYNVKNYLLGGHISSCHIQTKDIPREEIEKMSLYMTYIEDIIDSIDRRSGIDIKSVKIEINIGGTSYWIVFCYRKTDERKSIISFYTDNLLNDELLHLSFFLDSFIHLTFIKDDKLVSPSSKNSYRLYYNCNPDYENGLKDILEILKEILFQIFNTSTQIDYKFWCKNKNNDWTSLLNVGRTDLRDDIKFFFKSNLLLLMTAINFLDDKKSLVASSKHSSKRSSKHSSKGSIRI